MTQLCLLQTRTAELNIIVFGGGGGIGQALLREIRQRYPAAKLFATWHRCRPTETGIQWSQLDLTCEEQVKDYAQQFDQVHWLVNAVGILHTDTHGPEKSIRHFDPAFLQLNMQVNALPALLIAKHFMRALGHGQAAQFATVSARVGSIADNRLGGWYSYRCSKAALNMAIKNISLEWARTLPQVTVSSLHPGTTATALSEPFQAGVPEDKLFEPQRTAEYLVNLLAKLTPQDSGRFLAYDGVELPW